MENSEKSPRELRLEGELVLLKAKRRVLKAQLKLKNLRIEELENRIVEKLQEDFKNDLKRYCESKEAPRTAISIFGHLPVFLMDTETGITRTRVGFIAQIRAEHNLSLTEAAKHLVGYFNAGRYVTSESSSFAACKSRKA
jgi:hypothetical protein